MGRAVAVRLRCDGRDVAALELACSFRTRLRGLLRRDGLDGAILLRPSSQVHTLGMRFAIDVAFCDPDLVVLRTLTVRPGRFSPLVRGSRSVVEAEAGAFARWALREGSQLAVVEA